MPQECSTNLTTIQKARTITNVYVSENKQKRNVTVFKKIDVKQIKQRPCEMRETETTAARVNGYGNEHNSRQKINHS